MASITDMARTVHALAVEKGWWDKQRLGPASTDEVLAKLALIHSEVSEAVEEIRTYGVDPPYGARTTIGKPEGLGIELADIVIRVFDLAEALGLSIEVDIYTKHAYNRERPFRHGGKRA